MVFSDFLIITLIKKGRGWWDCIFHWAYRWHLKIVGYGLRVWVKYFILLLLSEKSGPGIVVEYQEEKGISREKRIRQLVCTKAKRRQDVFRIIWRTGYLRKIHKKQGRNLQKKWRIGKTMLKRESGKRWILLRRELKNHNSQLLADSWWSLRKLMVWK